MSNVETFSVGTFNTWGIPLSSPFVKERYRALVQHIERSSLDLIHLQEVWLYSLLGILRRKVPSYPYIAYKRGLFGPQAGLVTLSRFPLEDVQFIHFPPIGIPSRKRWWQRVRQSLDRKGVLLSFVPQWSITSCNCHLPANKADDWSSASRYYRVHEYALERLSSIINEQGQQKKDMLIMGDFNIPKRSELYQTFVHLSRAIDVFEEDDSPTYHEEFWPDPQRLDYVFLCLHGGCERVQVRQKDFLFREKVRLSNGASHYLSDHMGLMAELDFGDQSCS